MKKIVFILFTAFMSLNIHAQDIFNAARTNNISELRTYITQKIDVNQANSRGFSPLILAIYNNSQEAAKLLLENGANPNAQDVSGNNAIMGAIFKGHNDMVKLLIDNEANVNQVNYNGANSLIFAATFGNKDVAKMLLEAGADKTIKDNRNKTALDHATIQENIEMIELLK